MDADHEGGDGKVYIGKALEFAHRYVFNPYERLGARRNVAKLVVVVTGRPSSDDVSDAVRMMMSHTAVVVVGYGSADEVCRVKSLRKSVCLWAN